jgi:type I thyroxine 5'-deiodinase
VPALNKLYREYRDRAAFYVVYIQEAHAIDGWQTEENLEEDVLVASTSTPEERMKVAGACLGKLQIGFPAVVDDADESVERAYTGWPDRLYVIDRDGRIAHKGGPGPYGFKPEEVEATLALLLQAAPTGPEARGERPPRLY